MNAVIASPVYGEVSARLANNVLANKQLKYGLRKAYNILISRNMEMINRPPTHDMGALNDSGGSDTRSFSFKFDDGKFTVLTFSPLQINQHVVGGEDTFTTITTTWTSDDILKMDGCNYENDMIFTTPAKEPMIFQYDPSAGTYSWATLQSKKAGTNDPAWHAASEWPISVSFMIGRFVLVSKRHFYGSKAGDVLNWDIVTTTIDGDDVVTPSSAFAFNVADDLDSGFNWVRGGAMVFGGSPAGTWMMSQLEQPINTQNPNIKNYSSVGTYNVPAASIPGGHIYFCNDGVTMKLFSVGPNGVVNQVVNPFAKHFFEESPPKRIVFMRTPDTILWVLRENGTIVMFAMDDTRRSFGLLETGGIVKDIWLGKSDTNEYLYLDIDRGNDRRIERIEEIDPIDEPLIADGLLVHNEADAKSVESVSEGTNGEGVYTITAHGYSNGDLVRTIGIDDTYAYIVYLSADTFSLNRENLTLIEYSVGDDFAVRPAIKTITYAHLANKTLDVYADGYYSTVDADSSGKLTLDVPGSDITVGIPYVCYIEPPSFVDIHYQHIARVSKIYPRLYKARAVLYGKDKDNYTIKNLIPPGDESFSGTVQDLAIGSGMNHESSFVVGGTRTPFIMNSCIIDIEVGAN